MEKVTVRNSKGKVEVKEVEFCVQAGSRARCLGVTFGGEDGLERYAADVNEGDKP